MPTQLFLFENALAYVSAKRWQGELGIEIEIETDFFKFDSGVLRQFQLMPETRAHTDNRGNYHFSINFALWYIDLQILMAMAKK